MVLPTMVEAVEVKVEAVRGVDEVETALAI